MGTSPITIGVGNGAAWRLLLLLLTPTQRVAPPAQDQPSRAQQTEFVICEQAIENFFAKLKQYRAIATRYDKRAAHFLAAVHLASSVIWLN